MKLKPTGFTISKVLLHAFAPYHGGPEVTLALIEEVSIENNKLSILKIKKAEEEGDDDQSQHFISVESARTQDNLCPIVAMNWLNEDYLVIAGDSAIQLYSKAGAFVKSLALGEMMKGIRFVKSIGNDHLIVIHERGTVSKISIFEREALLTSPKAMEAELEVANAEAVRDVFLVPRFKHSFLEALIQKGTTETTEDDYLMQLLLFGSGQPPTENFFTDIAYPNLDAVFDEEEQNSSFEDISNSSVYGFLYSECPTMAIGGWKFSHPENHLLEKGTVTPPLSSSNGGGGFLKRVLTSWKHYYGPATNLLMMPSIISKAAAAQKSAMHLIPEVLGSHGGRMVAMHPNHALGAIADSKGRVIVVDFRNFRVISWLKGFRDAQLIWLSDKVILAHLPKSSKLLKWHFSDDLNDNNYYHDQREELRIPKNSFLLEMNNSSKAIFPKAFLLTPKITHLEQKGDSENLNAGEFELQFLIMEP